MKLCARALEYRYREGGPAVLRGLSFELASGSYWCVAGPNGAGKSTFLRLACGLLPTATLSGELAWIDGAAEHAVSTWDRLEMARRIAFVPGGLRTPFPVPVLNDAHAALLGEVWQGAARGCENVIMLTLGTGVGGAAMVDGRLLRGCTGKAGHLGHATLDMEGPPDICKMPGSLEVAIGNCTIRERSEGRFETTHDLIAAYLRGDAEAGRVWLNSVKALACAIGCFTNILDPEIAVIGGGIAQAGAALFEPLRRMVREVEWETSSEGIKIVPAQLGEYAGAFGAAHHSRTSR